MKYQFLWIFEELLCGCQIGIFGSDSMNIFRITHCVLPTTTILFRLSADPMVLTFAINRFNDAMDNFLGNSCKNF